MPEIPGARHLAVALLLAAAAGCAGPERTDAPIPEPVYVEVMARLAAVRTAADPGRHRDPLAPARADSLREAVLREHGVRRSELKEFARVVGDEPERMRRLWERIASRSDSLRNAGWPEDSLPGQGNEEDP